MIYNFSKCDGFAILGISIQWCGKPYCRFFQKLLLTGAKIASFHKITWKTVPKESSF